MDGVLYVDDDECNLKLFTAYLANDYNVLTAKNTAEAYEILKNNPVKVLISDQRMPGETGMEFMQRINPEFPQVIKMLFTAYADYTSISMAINQGGIFRYLLKPWNYEEMFSSIQFAIREYDLRKENQDLIRQLKVKNSVLEKAYTEIQNSENKCTRIFESSSDGMIVIRDKRVCEVNKAFMDIAGQFIEHISNDTIYQFIELNLSGIFKEDDQAIDKKPFRVIKELLSNHKEQKYLEITCRFFDSYGKQYVLILLRDVTEKELVEKRLMEAIFKTQEAEHTRYAQELHDGLGPVLSAVKMYMEWLCDEQHIRNRELIHKNAMSALDQAIAEVKEIANNLSPYVLQRFGLVNALKNHAEHLVDIGKIAIDIQSNLKERLDAHIEVMLYRVLMECINNTLKHADARKINICFEKLSNGLFVSYNDDGKGFDVENILAGSRGMGLINMQNRIKLLDGHIKIRSVIGKGTSVEIILSL